MVLLAVSASADETISLIYEKDDIRLCTMQRAIPQQKLGVGLGYHPRERFHYIEFYGDFQSSLAYRAGIKNFDRIIALNGINIENDTVNQLSNRFDVDQHLPLQMLVCSPATYAHYKSNNKRLDGDLPTVQCLKPAYATLASDCNTDTPVISVDDDSFCAVQWEDPSIISTVPQSAIFKSPEFTRVNDICFVETEEQYRKGKIIFIGSYSECEKLKAVSIKETHDAVTNSIPDFIGFQSLSPADMIGTLSLENSCQKLETNTMQTQVTVQNTNNVVIQHIQKRVCSTFEQLPNELFLYLFTYLDTPNLYNAFWGLNSRLNNVFQSYESLCLTFDDKTDQLLMKLYAPYIVRLIIDTPINCDFSQFHNLKTLILCNGNSKHLTQIQSKILPNLTHLSFLLGSKFTPSLELVRGVFSNRFPSLRHAHLGRIDEITTYSWSASPSLRFVSIRSEKPLIVSAILASCPNLDHFQLHVLDIDRNNINSYSPSNHPLRRFTLWSDSVELSFNDIDIILTYTPNVQHLYLQTICRMPFVDLANGLVNQLNRLSQFDGHVKEMINSDDRVGNLSTVHQLHPCFKQVECIEENDSFRIFATK